MTPALIKKGQNEEKTGRLFDLLRAYGICPMTMMMHIMTVNR